MGYKRLRRCIFGLLCTPFSFQSLSLLWSQSLFSQDIRTAGRKGGTFKTGIFPIAILVVCCVIASVAGPASALLFLPSESWLPAGSTEYYLRGTKSQLWPQNLTAADIGPTQCLETPPSLYFTCLHGGYLPLRNIINIDGMLAITEWEAFVKDAQRPRIIRGIYPNLKKEGNAHEQWAYTLHAATLWHARDLVFKHDDAWEYTSKMNQRMEDSVGLVQTEGLLPVTRTVCGPLQHIMTNTTTLPFPALEPDRYWRSSNATKPEELKDGPLVDLQIDILGKRSQANITTSWISPPQELGRVTAAVAFVTRNETLSIGRGCTVDARWATGTSSTHDGVTLSVWQSFIGRQPRPQGAQFNEPDYSAFLEPSVRRHLRQPINADQDWLDALAPTLEAPSKEAQLPPSTFDSLLLGSKLQNISYIVTKNTAREATQYLEFAVTVFFVDALSRIGWHLQLAEFGNSVDFYPSLQQGYVNTNKEDNAKIFRNKPIFDRPVDIPYVVQRQEWFSYATAWRLNQSSLYISVSVLGLHLIIAATHTVYNLWTGVTSEAWDSINDLLALAFNSSSKETLENCGAGIRLRRTLKHRVRVTVASGGGHQVGSSGRLQLVFCDDNPDVDNLGGGVVDVGKRYS
ncbi:hypothetical protein BDV96DRAFT_675435 [Lophiotrema nucula]|uniref:Uncharacterized protein n=1 Tax=Lophiotrema nucula TaxID=690887 RepID=A0A6A5YJU5_9PLEO|nr:hypothetical protein BDV96DRAFT_675435 [Lophiotrema nucula]